MARAWQWQARWPQGLDRTWVDEGFSATQAVVLTLMRRMEDQGLGHTVWLDTSARLLKRLRDLGIGGAGTVRTTKTQREEKETRDMAKEKAKGKAKEKEGGLKAGQSISQSQVRNDHGFCCYANVYKCI